MRCAESECKKSEDMRPKTKWMKKKEDDEEEGEEEEEASREGTVGARIAIKRTPCCVARGNPSQKTVIGNTFPPFFLKIIYESPSRLRAASIYAS